MEVNGQPVRLLYSRGEIASGTHWIGGWMDPRAGMDSVENRKTFSLPGIKPRQSSPLLYKISYPDSSPKCKYIS
jgi:hypothetical protein